MHREIGFSFDNQAMFNFTQNIGVKDGNELQAWQQKNGENASANEMAFAAAQAWCMHERIKDNFTKEGLLKALNLTPKEITDKIAEEYKLSVLFKKKPMEREQVKKMTPRTKYR
jgi:hypothetical protein